MIECFEGRLGAGKTYHAVVRAIDHWRHGLVVCSNVEFKWDNCKAYCLRKFGVHLVDAQYISLSDEEIGLFHKFTPSGTRAGVVLVIIDEAHLVFNSRDWANTHKNFKETLVFLTQSRKVSTDVIFISQSALNMDKQFARLFQYIWRFRDLSMWRIPVLMIKYPFQTLLAVQYDYDGKTILRKNYRKKDGEVFDLYETNSLLKEFPRLENVETKHTLQTVVKPPLHPMIKLLIPLIVIGVLFGGWKLYQSSKGGSDGVVAKTTSATIQDAVKPKTSPPSASPRNVNITENDDSVLGQGAYDIYSERFVAWSQPDHSLKTEKTWYTLGEMSPKGYVTGISDRRVKLITPAGRTAWVVASKDRAAVSSTPIPRLTPSPTPAIIIAKDSARTPDAVPLTSSPTPLEGYGRMLRDSKAGRIPRPSEVDRLPDNQDN